MAIYFFSNFFFFLKLLNCKENNSLETLQSCIGRKGYWENNPQVTMYGVVWSLYCSYYIVSPKGQNYLTFKRGREHLSIGNLEISFTNLKESPVVRCCTKNYSHHPFQNKMLFFDEISKRFIKFHLQNVQNYHWSQSLPPPPLHPHYKSVLVLLPQTSSIKLI